MDIHPLCDDQWTGIPIFTRRLVQALQRDERLDPRFCCGRVRIPCEAVNAAIRAGAGTALRDDCTRNLKRYGPIDRQAPLLIPSVKRVSGLAAHEASTVHDLSTLFMPETHEHTNVVHHMGSLLKELASDEVVFCVSEATRAALVTAFPSVSPKVKVLYQYVEWPADYVCLERNLPAVRMGRYAVVVGTIEPRKNLALILNSLGTREVGRSDIKFVVIGRPGWLTGNLVAQLTAAERKRVLFTGYVSEFTKYRLIKNAEFLVYPSLYEGFGIPALEAMSLGKPILAARTSSFPEVIGDAGVFFDPLSIAEFAAAFELIQHRYKLTELASRALAQAARFSWQRMATTVAQWACS